MLTNDDQLILGIESAIYGGSLSICRRRMELGSWTGEGNVSRAEDLLPNIDRLLTQLSLQPSDIDTIVCSRGPGSFTGIRIGLATALGLRASINARCLAITSLEAMACWVGDGNATVAVPMGREMICVQQFKNNGAVTEPSLVACTELLSLMSNSASETFVLHGSISLNAAEIPPSAKVIDSGFNIARLLCLYADSPFANKELAPLFVDRTAFTKM